MSSLYQKSLTYYVLSLVILGLISISVYQIFSQHNRQKLIENYQTQALAFFNEEKNRKLQLTKALAISYSNMPFIQNALLDEDRETLNDAFFALKDTFSEQTPYKRYSFHFFTSDGRSLYRSYAPGKYGQDASSHPLVKAVIEKQTPVEKLHIGGYSNGFRFIHMQPVFQNGEFIGIIAVSQGLRRFLDFMPTKGFEYGFFVTKNAKESPRTFTMDARPYFQNSAIIDLSFSEKDLKQKSVFQLEDKYVFILPEFDETQRISSFHSFTLSESTFEKALWQQQKQLLLLIIVVSIFIAIFAGLYLMLIRNNISRPIARLTRTTNEIINTQDYSKRLDIQSSDEIGKLSSYFDHLLSNTEDLIHQLNYLNEIVDKILIVSKTDPYGNIIYVNDNFCEISGYTREELIGKPHNIVRHPEMPSDTFQEVWRTIKAKKAWTGEIRNLKKDGSDYYVISHIVPILNKEKNIAEFMSIRQDITLMVRLRDSLSEAIRNEKQHRVIAEHANKAKSEFLSSMSHELRTPLNAIIGFSQVLEISGLDEKQLRRVKNIHTSGLHLLELINDVLEFAKIDAGNLALSIEEVHLSPIIQEVITLATPLAQNLNIQISADSYDSDYILLADKVRLKQVILNLVTNAIKYNRPDGQVFIHCHTSTDEQALCLCVKDTGLGIAKDHLDNLFQAFNRLGRESTSIEGTGIGLTITKALIEKMDGNITVDSTEGEGSTFKIEMPLVKKLSVVKNFEPDMPAVVELPSKPYKDYALRVLYVEDNALNVELMQDILKDYEQLTLLCCSTAEEGLEKAKAFKPNVIILDINLPGLNGDQALPFFKALPELRDIHPRIYALSANVVKEQIAVAMQAGFEDYLQKPIEIQTLYDLLETAKLDLQ